MEIQIINGLKFPSIYEINTRVWINRILDDNSERIYPIRVRPRFTWHGGEAPTAISVEKRI